MRLKTMAATLSIIAAGTLVSVADGAQVRGWTGERGNVDTLRAAARATSTYEGSFKGAGQGPSSIVIKAARQGGEVTKVKSFKYTALMECDISGPTPGQAGWNVGNIADVKPNRRFRAKGNDGQTPRSSLDFKGRFSKDFKKVTGRFVTKQWFEAEEKLPAEHCLLDAGYSAER